MTRARSDPKASTSPAAGSSSRQRSDPQPVGQPVASGPCKLARTWSWGGGPADCWGTVLPPKDAATRCWPGCGPMTTRSMNRGGMLLLGKVADGPYPLTASAWPIRFGPSGMPVTSGTPAGKRKSLGRSSSKKSSCPVRPPRRAPGPAGFRWRRPSRVHSGAAKVSTVAHLDGARIAASAGLCPTSRY